MNHKNLTRFWSLPTCDVVVILASGKRHEMSFRIAFSQTKLCLTKRFVLEDIPWLDVKQAKLHDMLKLTRIFEPTWKL